MNELEQFRDETRAWLKGLKEHCIPTTDDARAAPPMVILAASVRKPSTNSGQFHGRQ